VRWLLVPAAVLAAVLVIFVVVGLLLDVTRSVASRSVCSLQAWSRVQGALTCVPPEPDKLDIRRDQPVHGTVLIHLNLSAQQMTVIYDLNLPKSHALVDSVTQGVVDTQGERSYLQWWMLGSVEVKTLTSNTDYPAGVSLGYDLQEPKVRFSEHSDRAHLRIASAPLDLPAGQYELRLQPPEDGTVTVGHVRMLSPDLRVYVPSGAPKPVSVGVGRLLVKPGVGEEVRLTLSRPVPGPARADDSLRGFLRRAYDFSLPVAGLGLAYAVYGAPLLLWLLLARRPHERGHDPDWFRGAAVAAVFTAITTVVLIVGDDILRHEWLSSDPTLGFLRQHISWLRVTGGTDQSQVSDWTQTQLLADSGPVVAALALAVVIPFVIRQRQPPPWGTSRSQDWRPRLVRGLQRLCILILLAAPITVAIMGVWMRERRWLPGDLEQLAADTVGQPLAPQALWRPVLVAALILGVALGVLLRTVLPYRHAVFGALVGVVAALDLILLFDLVRRLGAAGRAVSTAILLITAFWLVFTLAGLAVSGATRSAGWWGRRWWGKATIGLVILVVALPYQVLMDRQLPAYQWEDVFALAAASTRLLLMVAVVWILAWLHNSSDRLGWRLPEAARWLGLLLAILTVFRPTFRFVYVPVATLVGAAILRFWVYQEPPALVQSGRVARDEDRAELLDAKAELRRVEKHLDQARQHAQEELDKGGITPDKYAERVDAAKGELEELKRTQRARFGETGDKVGLNIGPRRTPWASGLVGAGWAAVFSIPWIVLYIRRVAHDGGGPFPLLWTAIPLIEQVISWVGIGFLFGYFYTVIRGRTGLEKGVWIAVTLVLSRACATALLASGNPDLWRLYWPWAVEVAALSALLGLVAGDLATLSSVGWPWRRIRELQEVGWLAGGASSLLVALGSVITTLLSGAVGKFVEFTFNQTPGGSGP
jgi:hypothetical protein